MKLECTFLALHVAMFEPVRPIFPIPDPRPSIRQSPGITTPRESSESENPEGQYTGDSFVRRKLCKQTAALTNETTFSGEAEMGCLKILHLAVMMPNAFSIVLRALDSRELKIC